MVCRVDVMRCVLSVDIKIHAAATDILRMISLFLPDEVCVTVLKTPKVFEFVIRCLYEGQYRLENRG